VKGEKGAAMIQVGERAFFPEEVFARLLYKMR
jgi:hypothetical protein